MFQKISSKVLNLPMTWRNTLILALIAGAYTGLIAQAKFLADTSISDIAVTYEWWVFFAMIIIVNQKRWWEAGLKTILFFLVSQTVVFLVEFPIVGEFYFAYWYRWMEIALLTLPGGIFAWLSTKRHFAADIVLSIPVALLCITGVMHTIVFLRKPPFHILSFIFCFLQAIFWIFSIKEAARDRILTSVFTVIFTVIGCVFLL